MNPEDEFPRIPYWGYIGLTYACNCNCRHCYVKERVYKKRYILQKEDFFRLLDQLHSLGTISITYSHGESLLHPNCHEIFSYAHGQGFAQILISNGLLIDPLTIEKLEHSGIDTVLLSMDSIYQFEHDKNRGRYGSFSSLTSAIDLLASSKIKERGLAVTVAPRNEDEIEAIIEKAIRSGLNCISLLSERVQGYIVGPDTVKFIEIIKKYKDKINTITHDMRLLRYVKDLGFDRHRKKVLFTENNTCYCSQNIISIDMYGDVTPCNFVNYIYGNCLDKSIVEIWKTIVSDTNPINSLCCKIRRMDIEYNPD